MQTKKYTKFCQNSQDAPQYSDSISGVKYRFLEDG